MIGFRTTQRIVVKREKNGDPPLGEAAVYPEFFFRDDMVEFRINLMVSRI